MIVAIRRGLSSGGRLAPALAGRAPAAVCHAGVVAAAQSRPSG